VTSPNLVGNLPVSVHHPYRSLKISRLRAVLIPVGVCRIGRNESLREADQKIRAAIRNDVSPVSKPPVDLLAAFEALRAEVKCEARRMLGPSSLLEERSCCGTRFRRTENKIARPECRICCGLENSSACFFNHLGTPDCLHLLRPRFARTILEAFHLARTIPTRLRSFSRIARAS